MELVRTEARVERTHQLKFFSMSISLPNQPNYEIFHYKETAKQFFIVWHKPFCMETGREKMQSFMDVIKKRRSIRHYTDQEVPQDLLNQVLEAVQWSPSWANTQCWEIVVVNNRETKQEIKETISKGNPAAKAIVDAPIVLAICGKINASGYYKGEVTTKFGDWLLYDLGIATQSICLAAHALGLGTVVVGLFDHDRVKEILQVPEGVEVASLIPLGFPGKGSGAPKRREISEFTHYNRF